MNVLFFIIGLIIGALLVGFVLKSKNSSLQTQIDFMKEQELKNEELRNKQFETQINALKSELQNTTEKLLRQREESLVRANSVQLDAVLNPLKNEIEGMKKSMVDNIKTNSENKASIEKAIELSESADFSIMRDEIQTYIEIMLDKDIIDILEIPTSMEKYKKDAISVLDMIINYFRDIMLLKEKVDKSMIINIDKLTFIQNMSKKITYSQVSKIIDIIEDIKKKIRSNCNFNISIQVMALNIYEVIK